MRPARNHRRGASYLTSIAQSAVRPFHYRSGSSRLLAQFSSRKMTHKIGVNSLIGHFNYMAYGHDNGLSAPPLNAGYLSHGTRYMQGISPFSESKIDATKTEHILNTSNRQPGASDFDVNAGVNETLHVNAGVQTSELNKLVGDPVSNIEGDLFSVKPKLRSRNLNRDSEQEIEQRISEKEQKGQTLNQLLGKLGDQLETYNYGERSEITQQHNPAQPEIHKSSGQNLREVAIPGETTKEFVKNVNRKTSRPEFVSLDGSETEATLSTNYSDKKVTTPVLVKQDNNNPSNKPVYSNPFENNRAVKYIKTTPQSYLGEVSDVQQMKLNYLANKNTSVQHEMESEKQDAQVKKITRQVKVTTKIKPTNNYRSVSNNDLQRRHMGNSRLRVYK